MAKLFMDAKRLKKLSNSYGSIHKKGNLSLFVLCLPAIIKLFIFSYIPLMWVLIAFEQFIPRRGILGSPWIWFQNFEYLFASQTLSTLLRNAVVYNLLFTIFGLIAALTVGLFLFEIARKYFIKVTQTILIFPHFISWPLLGTFVSMMMGKTGVFTNAINLVTGSTIDFYTEPKYWYAIMTGVHMWKTAGFSAVTFYAILTGIDRGIFEAAKIDGATRFKQIFYISLPMLKYMIVVNFIMHTANILRVNFSMMFYVTNNSTLLLETTDVIETYMYRAMRTVGNFSVGAAVGLFQGVVGLILTFFTNKLANKLTGRSLY